MRLSEMTFVTEPRDIFYHHGECLRLKKSYIATALGYRACQKGMRVLYASTARLMLAS